MCFPPLFLPGICLQLAIIFPCSPAPWSCAQLCVMAGYSSKEKCSPRSNMADSLQSLLVITMPLDFQGDPVTGPQSSLGHLMTGKVDLYIGETQKTGSILTDPSPAWSPDKLPDSFEPSSSSAGRK